MIDCHSHIIFDVDDGCKTLEDSINTIKNLNSIGFNKIVLTPHYLKGSDYIKNNKEKKERLNILKEKLKEENINVELFLGNEIYITDDIDDLVMNKKATTINKSRYILIELPLYNKLNNVEDFIYELKIKGYIPVIAHPERYSYYSTKDLYALYESGVLFQCNYGSIIGNYGKDAIKLIEYLLKNDMITFMATDIHRPESSIIENFLLIRKKIESIIGEEKFKKISNDNILKMINDEEIED